MGGCIPIGLAGLGYKVTLDREIMTSLRLANLL